MVGSLVGAAVALLYRPRRGGPAYAALARVSSESPDALLARGRQALRARFQQATKEAHTAASETQQRLETEYRVARDGS
jgi:gas vesicle protein